jgi:hypothetical protein
MNELYCKARQNGIICSHKTKNEMDNRQKGLSIYKLDMQHAKTSRQVTLRNNRDLITIIRICASQRVKSIGEGKIIIMVRAKLISK